MKPEVQQRPIDRQFEEYDGLAQNVSNPWLLRLGILFFMFGLVAFAWALPFPHLGFLGRYNGYLNWASFLIAGMIYYYLRLSPVLSYVILFLLFAFSYGIIQLEQVQKSGGVSLWVIGLAFMLIGIGYQYLTLHKPKIISFIAKGPVWLIIALLKSVKLKY